MLNRLIQLSLANRPMVLVIALALVVLGTKSAVELPVEVLPDLTKPTVTILTESPGLAPEEVERLVTIPMENELMGVTGVSRLRTISDVGLSLTYVEFDWDTDIYQARQFVQEKLASMNGELPEGVTPFMTPVSSLMGEILLIGLTDPTGELSPGELRTMADWKVARRLQGISGVAEVLSMGGGIRQLEILPDPERMLVHGVSYDQVRTAAAQAVSNSTGGFLDEDSKEIMVRNLAMTTDLSEVGNTEVRFVNDRPVRLKDVATIAWGTQPMRGDAAANGHRGVLLSVTKSPGFDTIELTNRVEEALAELKVALPPGVEIEPVYRQADYISLSIGNLKEALRDGAIMVILVLILFLLNLRVTLITLTAIPLSLAISFLVFDLFGLSVNSMTLGGLAVAMGMVVDDAIVDVENVFRRLRENASRPKPSPRLKVVAAASREIRGSIFYATILIILVFIPLLWLSGVEGRLFAPIAIATIVSMAASFLVSLTVIPVLASYWLKPRAGKQHRDSWLVRGAKWIYLRLLLRPSLSFPTALFGLTALLLAAAAALYPMMGKDFLPEFREPTVVIATTTAPGTSLKQTTEVADTAMRLIREIPEVKTVAYRAGRAERGDHVVPVSTVEFEVDFKEDRERSLAEIKEDLKDRMKGIPGTFSSTSGPLADRIGHMLSGVPAKIAIKVYGEDLEELRLIGEKIQAIAQTVPGLEDAKIEQQADIPQLRIEINRERATAYGIKPGELNRQLATLLGGEQVGEIYEGEKVFGIVVRLPLEWRESPERLSNLRIDTASAAQVPLKSLADIRQAYGPNNIKRENTQRRFVVSINPTSDDLVTLVETLQAKVAEELEVPPGYFVTWEGDYLAQQRASKDIGLMFIAVLIFMGALLYNHFKSIMFPLQVMVDIPLALIGGLALAFVTKQTISISTLVGFIAVAGIAARNSIMLISHYLHVMQHEGEEFTREMIERATLERLVPVLMTALSAGIALIPLALAGETPGKEILNPVAIIIIGGLVSSTLLGLMVTPAMFWAYGRHAANRYLALATNPEKTTIQS